MDCTTSIGPISRCYSVSSKVRTSLSSNVGMLCSCPWSKTKFSAPQCTHPYFPSLRLFPHPRASAFRRGERRHSRRGRRRKSRRFFRHQRRQLRFICPVLLVAWPVLLAISELALGPAFWIAGLTSPAVVVGRGRVGESGCGAGVGICEAGTPTRRRSRSLVRQCSAESGRKNRTSLCHLTVGGPR